jgi:hypothetical protein
LKFLVLLLSLVVLVPSGSRADSVRYTGTFSSFEYNESEGDVVGAELRIVPARGSYEGTFQFAEGEPDHLSLIKVEVQGDTIKFSVPPPCMYEGEFEGHIDGKGVRGTLKPKHGKPIELVLPRKCGLWDQAHGP